MSKTYTIAEAKKHTTRFIEEQAEILRQELRDAHKTSQLILENA